MRNATMLYKAPGSEPIHGHFLSTLVIDADEEGELEAAVADGWFLTTPEAIKAHEEAKAANVGNWQAPGAPAAPANKAKK